MSKTLQQILIDTANYLDLDNSLPTGTELEVRTGFADRALREAANTGQLREFKKTYITNSGTGATLALPTDFRELMIEPKLMETSGGWRGYTVIEPEQQYDMDEGDYWCYQQGNMQDGYFLVFNSPIENTTLSITYQSHPEGFTTLTSKCEIPDADYISTRIEFYILDSRDDARADAKRVEAERKLGNMIGRGSKKIGGGINRVRKNFKNPLS